MENSSQIRTTETPSHRRTKKVIYHDDGRPTVIIYCPCGKYGVRIWNFVMLIVGIANDLAS